MRFFRPEYYNDSCGVTALSILTGWKFSTIRNLILAARKRFPRDYRGYQCQRARMMESTGATYLSEIQNVLRRKKIKIRFRDWKMKTNLANIPERYKKGVYIVYVPNHVLILRNGKVWDNSGEDQELESYYWRYDLIVSTAKIS